ncbi:entericidin [Chelativorans salis]|uniref:Entericidin n=1 Tax=Chelativorans salis TaxID=2978478 RepID=A0ABT2LNK0_9HYPH|nr:entericidin [Chelativorans sp. EGI FJ00035]MCT7375253.1 entericidin [Chelativorans sp. EGI FJ00035]
MYTGFLSRIAIVIAIIGLAGGCANTIRGVGQDTANVVDATQQAGQNVGGAAEY